MTSDLLLLAYVGILLGALLILAAYSEIRGRRFRSERSEDHVFRCDKCGFVYTDDPDVDRSRCPQCGTVNDAIRF